MLLGVAALMDRISLVEDVPSFVVNVLFWNERFFTGRKMLGLVAVLSLLVVFPAFVEYGRRAAFRSVPMEFEGKRILVTGSSGGLGKQIALDLCAKKV